MVRPNHLMILSILGFKNTTKSTKKFIFISFPYCIRRGPSQGGPAMVRPNHIMILSILGLKNTTKSPERFIFYQFSLEYPKGSQPGGGRHCEA